MKKMVSLWMLKLKMRILAVKMTVSERKDLPCTLPKNDSFTLMC